MSISTSGDLVYNLGPNGVTFEDTRPKGMLFKITGGSNPYAADQLILDPDAGTTSTANGMVLTAAMELLWELRGVTTVAANTVVWAYPNPLGAQTGWIFEAPASVTAKESDGTPSYAGVTTFEFDQADGFSLSQPGAGRVKVNVSTGGLMTVKEFDGSPSYSSVTSLEFDQDETFVVTQPGAGRAKVSRSSPVNGSLLLTCTITTADTWTALGGGSTSAALQAGRYLLNAGGILAQWRFNTPYTGTGFMQASFWNETSNTPIGTNPIILAAVASEVNGNLVLTCGSDTAVVDIPASAQIAARFLWTANGTGATFTTAAVAGGTMTWVRLGP